MELVVKVVLSFALMVCLTSGKYVRESVARDTQYSTGEKLEIPETLEDRVGETYDRRHMLIPQFLATEEDSYGYQNLCEEETKPRKVYELFGNEDKEYQPPRITERFCASDTGGGLKRCGSNYCVTQEEVRDFYSKPRGSSGRWRRERRNVRIGCSCMVRT